MQILEGFIAIVGSESLNIGSSLMVVHSLAMLRHRHAWESCTRWPITH